MNKLVLITIIKFIYYKYSPAFLVDRKGGGEGGVFKILGTRDTITAVFMINTAILLRGLGGGFIIHIEDITLGTRDTIIFSLFMTAILLCGLGASVLLVTITTGILWLKSFAYLT